MTPTGELDQWRAAKKTLTKAGLPVPPVPASLEASIQNWDEMAWGTGPAAPFRLSDTTTFVQEYLAAALADFVAFGQDGHGTNSWFFYHYIVRGPVAICNEVPWGGAYTDASKAAQRLERRYAVVEEILAAATQATADGKTLPGRLVILQTTTRPSRWAWVKEGEAPQWNDDLPNDNAMTPALLALRGPQALT